MDSYNSSSAARPLVNDYLGISLVIGGAVAVVTVGTWVEKLNPRLVKLDNGRYSVRRGFWPLCTYAALRGRHGWFARKSVPFMHDGDCCGTYEEAVSKLGEIKFSGSNEP